MAGTTILQIVSQIHPEYNQALYRWARLGYELSFTIDYEMWLQINKVVQPDFHTLEFGCGVSTSAFKKAEKHTAIESNREQVKKFVSAQYAPVVDGWYDWTPKDLYDVILVDGPHEGHRNRGLETILSASHPETIFFIDDSHRPEEKALAVEIGRATNKTVTLNRTANKHFSVIQ